MQINTTDWKDFKIKDWFEVYGSKTTKLDDLIEIGAGIYPYVTTRATNNGVDCFYNYYTENANVITIDSAVLGTAFYQNKEFSASDHVEILKPKNGYFSKNVGLFITTIINLENFRYNYGRKSNQKNVNDTIIKLPAKLNSNNEFEPDWEYMGNFIEELETRERERVKTLLGMR